MKGNLRTKEEKGERCKETKRWTEIAINPADPVDLVAPAGGEGLVAPA